MFLVSWLLFTSCLRPEISNSYPHRILYHQETSKVPISTSLISCFDSLSPPTYTYSDHLWMLAIRLSISKKQNLPLANRHLD
ncbi:hypothetical protein F4806DRAFT_188323 [Annulohypoxylon nitens]|nr:hypothetical protein F4806DRAFT_188323 [Annulohypoxylon nitens]